MRKLPNWLDSFIEFGQVGEAPNHVLLWSGVSAIAGALGRKVYVDQLTFRWFPNMYVVVVAPPGVIAKTTTTGLAMDLLKRVDDVFFGPNITTWQALVDAFEKAVRLVEYRAGETVETHSLTIHSGELGNLVSTDDQEIMNLLITLWDCGAIEKATKQDGTQKLEHPFLNLIACTTPSWISGNLPMHMIDGGLVSRIVWVYADEKRREVMYPGLQITKEEWDEHQKMRRYLIDDLGAISRLEGEFSLEPDAVAWGVDWYSKHCKAHSRGKDDSRLGGFHARKPAHIHKLAMVLSASRGDSLRISREDLEKAEVLVSALEETLLQIFDRIGKSESANVADRLVEFVSRAGARGVSLENAFLYIRGSLPRPKDFDEIWKGLRRSGMIEVTTVGSRQVFRAPQADKGDSTILD